MTTFWMESYLGKKYDPDHLIPFNSWIKKVTFHTHLSFFNGEYIINSFVKGFYKHSILNYAFDENKKCIVDRVIKVENLQSEFNEICKILNIPKVEIKTLNRTNHKHYRDYYNSETKSIIEKDFAYDIEIGKYTF
jgi:hypothetical protein